MSSEIFCDLDQVLVDFDKGYLNLTGVNKHHHTLQDSDLFWKLYRDSLVAKNMTEKSYWSNLEWMIDGKELWDYIKQYKPNILSAPAINRDISYPERFKITHNESMQGKTKWCERLDGLNKTYFTSAKFKPDLARKHRILIDDRADTVNAWRDNGGVGIIHTSTANTIKQLKQLGL